MQHVVLVDDAQALVRLVPLDARVLVLVLVHHIVCSLSHLHLSFCLTLVVSIRLQRILFNWICERISVLTLR